MNQYPTNNPEVRLIEAATIAIDRKTNNSCGVITGSSKSKSIVGSLENIPCVETVSPFRNCASIQLCDRYGGSSRL